MILPDPPPRNIAEFEHLFLAASTSFRHNRLLSTFLSYQAIPIALSPQGAQRATALIEPRAVLHSSSMDSTALPASNDDRAPWQSVISKFKHDIGPLKFAADIQAAQQRVVNIARQLMREVIADWNSSKVPCSVPPEVLATCFSFLSLKELFVATRVSHAWRAIALSCPSLWSRASFLIGAGTHPNLLELVLQRSRQTLLDIDIEFTPEYADSVASLLDGHMHRMRHLSWSPQLSLVLCQPAPVLESLNCAMSSWIPENLLGGLPGRLRSLTLYSLYLPPRCPALSTVTSLTVDLKGGEEEAATLMHLFSICPLLELLVMTGLADLHFPFLLAGTPTHLRALELHARRSRSADLARYVSAWAPANPHLSRIDLSMDFQYIPTHSASIFLGAKSLTISQRTNQPVLRAIDVRGRTCAVVLRDPWNRTYDAISCKIASIIRPHGALLSQLRVLRAPVTVLSRLFNPAPAMPALRTLTVLVQAWDDETESSREVDVFFPAEHLSFLAETGSLLDHARIEIVALLARGTTIYHPDMQPFVDTLATSLPARDQKEDVEIEIRGLRDELRAQDLPRVKGYRIRLLGEDQGS